MNANSSSDNLRVRVTVDLRRSTVTWLDSLREAHGFRSRGDALNHILDELAQQKLNPKEHLAIQIDDTDHKK